jgi:hypothetical protein
MAECSTEGGEVMDPIQVVAAVVLCVIAVAFIAGFLFLLLFSDLGQPTALDEYEAEQARRTVGATDD